MPAAGCVLGGACAAKSMEQIFPAKQVRASQCQHLEQTDKGLRSRKKLLACRGSIGNGEEGPLSAFYVSAAWCAPRSREIVLPRDFWYGHRRAQRLGP